MTTSPDATALLVLRLAAVSFPFLIDVEGVVIRDDGDEFLLLVAAVDIITKNLIFLNGCMEGNTCEFFQNFWIPGRYFDY